jgi:hypothetical protein
MHTNQNPPDSTFYERHSKKEDKDIIERVQALEADILRIKEVLHIG